MAENIQVEIDDRTTEAILKLHTLMILANQKINEKDVNQAVYYLNKKLKLRTNKKHLKKYFSFKINLYEELSVISKANLPQRAKEVILEFLIMIAVSDSNYDKQETELVFKTAKEFNININNQEVERLTKLQKNLYEINIKIREGEKNVENIFQNLNNYKSEIKDPGHKTKVDDVKNKLNNLIDSQSESINKVGKVLSDAIKYGEITNQEYFHYLDFMKKMPMEFQILSNSLAGIAPEKYIKNIKKFNRKDDKVNKNKIVVWGFFAALLIFFILIASFA